MKHTKQPVMPKGYTGKYFNGWQAYLQAQIDKIKGTNVAIRLR